MQFGKTMFDLCRPYGIMPTWILLGVIFVLSCWHDFMRSCRVIFFEKTHLVMKSRVNLVHPIDESWWSFSAWSCSICWAHFSYLSTCTQLMIIYCSTLEVICSCGTPLVMWHKSLFSMTDERWVRKVKVIKATCVPCYLAPGKTTWKVTYGVTR